MFKQVICPPNVKILEKQITLASASFPGQRTHAIKVHGTMSVKSLKVRKPWIIYIDPIILVFPSETKSIT